jgi:integrase
MKELEKLFDKDGKEIKFPYTHKKGSVSVRIYRTPTRGCDSYTLSYWQDGKRKRPTFSTFEKALAEAKAVASKLGSASGDVLTLTSADRASYLRARELSVDLGLPLEVIVSQMVAVKRVLGDTPPMVAAEYYKKMHPTKLQLMLVKTVIDEMLVSKRGDGLSEGYLQHLGYDLKKFNQTFSCNIGSITGGEIDGWLRGLKVSGRTRNNLRCSVNTLFCYAKTRRYLAKDHDELDAVGLAKDREGEIEIFTPAEVIEILSHARDEIMPFLLIGAFAGVRHIEIKRLAWDDIRLDDGLIEIRAQNAKTASRRMVPLLPNLREWLMGYREDTGPVCEHRNIGSALQKLTKRINESRRRAWAQKHGVTEEQLAANEATAKNAAKAPASKPKKHDVPPGAETAKLEGWTAFEWKHNALRHSWISYRVAQIQNVAQVALEAGNSPRMVFSNYRELVRTADAEKWFGITPATVEAAKAAREKDAVEQIVPIPVELMAAG